MGLGGPIETPERPISMGSGARSNGTDIRIQIPTEGGEKGTSTIFNGLRGGVDRDQCPHQMPPGLFAWSRATI
jgi:hypothetical protein